MHTPVRYFLSTAAALLLAFSMSAFAQSGSPGQSGAAQAGNGNSETNQAKSANKAKLDRSDENFIKKAAEGGLAEVELGNLAVEKASSNEVKQFGQKMVDDHSKANRELQQLAASKGITLPDKPSMGQRAEKTRLQHASGAKFDKAYMDYMVKDHTNDVKDFRDEVQSARDPQVKEFAQKTLPTLESHLKKAETVDTNVKTGKAESSEKTSQSAANSKSKSY